MDRQRVALVTCSKLPGLTDDDRPLLGELWALGIQAEAAVWDDPSVDWSRYSAAVIRSTWDYYLSPASFAAWLARIEAAGVALWNPPAVVRANWDKTYLKGLEAAGVSVVPTLWVEKGRSPGLDGLLASRGWTEAVVKPVISAGAFRTSRVKRGEAEGERALADVLAHSGAMIQPYLAEIAAEGEWSFVFLGGAFSHAVLKSPKRGDFRVQEEHGGTTAAKTPPDDLLAQAREAARLSPGPWLYARVDGVRRGTELVVIEVELVEPSLYLGFGKGAAKALAAGIREKLASGPQRPPTPSSSSAGPV